MDNAIEEEWDNQFENMQNAQIDIEIEKSQQYLEMLQNQKSALQAKLETLANEPNYITSFKIKQPILIGSSIPETGSFFKMVQDLEDLDQELKTQYENEKRLSSELSHQKNVSFQKLKKLQSTLNTYKAQLQSEEDRSLLRRDAIINEEDQLIRTEIDHQEELQNLNSLNNELMLLTKHIQNQTRETLDGLEGRITELQIELDETQFQESQIRSELQELQLMEKRQQEKLEKDIEKAKNIKFEQDSKISLMNRLRQLEEQIKIEKNDLYTAQSRESSIQDSFIGLFPNDPGDGSCDEIKALIQGKIDQVKSGLSLDLFEELEIETYYENDLKKQLETIDNTIETLQESHEQTKKGLMDELSNCQNDGYVKLLRKEMEELQAKVAKF